MYKIDSNSIWVLQWNGQIIQTTVSFVHSLQPSNAQMGKERIFFHFQPHALYWQNHLKEACEIHFIYLILDPQHTYMHVCFGCVTFRPISACV